MNNLQYDALLKEIVQISKTLKSLTSRVDKIEKDICEIKSKTIISTDIEKQLNTLKTDIQSLRDEQEA